MVVSPGSGGTATTTPSPSPPIRTPDQRLRVFVSSTLGELAEERAVVRRAVEQLHLIPVLFELGARPHPPQELYRAYLAQSHVFLGLYWERYGWIGPGQQVSGLEDEFRLGASMPRLLYIKEPAPDRDPQLARMLHGLEVDGSASYRRFTTLDELERLVLDDLAVLISERFEAAGEAGGAARRRPGSSIHPAPPPVPLTRTVGRDADVDAVLGLLRDGVRLVTLSGPGGIGKSRLALEVANRACDLFRDGVAFVPLEAVTEPARLLPTLRERLRVGNPNGRSDVDVLVDALGEKHLLLLLDNFEQLVAAAPDLGQVLDMCPGVSALVTSRQVLRLRAEHEYAVEPLQQADAEDLFVQRATAASAGFRLTSDNHGTVRELCRRLDGLPLALELAAARIRLLPPAALLDRLEQRLDLLTSGAADLPQRQRTLRATLDWSHRLLDDAEQTLLARLSVFAGGASLDAVEAVCADEQVPAVLETLSSLLEKSLLVSVVGDAGQPRLQLLQVVRDYAAEQLASRGDAVATQRRHAWWYAELAEPADVGVHDRAHEHWPVLEADISNLRAAGRWALQHGDVPLATALAERTWAWAWMSGRLPEFGVWVEQVLEMAHAAGQPHEKLGSLTFIVCEARYMTGDVVGASALIDDAVDQINASGDTRWIAAAHMARSTFDNGMGRYDRVAADLDLAVELADRTDNGWIHGYACAIRGSFRMFTGDLSGAREDLEKSMRTGQRIGLRVLEAQAHGQLVWLHLFESPDADSGALADARWHLDQELVLLRESGNLEGLGYALDSAAGLALAEQRPRDAALALGAAAGIRERLQMPAWPLLGGLHDDYVAAVRQRLGADVADALIAGATRQDPWDVSTSVVGDPTDAIVTT